MISSAGKHKQLYLFNIFPSSETYLDIVMRFNSIYSLNSQKFWVKTARFPEILCTISRYGSKQLSLNKFFDPSPPSMRKGRDGETGKKKREKTDENSGHYVIASSRPPERRPLERRTLAPKIWRKRGKNHVIMFTPFLNLEYSRFKFFHAELQNLEYSRFRFSFSKIQNMEWRLNKCPDEFPISDRIRFTICRSF